MANGRSRSYRPDISRNLDVEGLIGAPLVATARANSMMAREQTQLMMDFCFSKQGDVYHPVMIQMSITRGVLEPGDASSPPGMPNLRQVKTSFSLPLLTVIPFSSLAVQDVTLDFDLEITMQSQREAEQVRSGTVGQPAAVQPAVRLQGKVSYDSEERARSSSQGSSKRQNHAKLDVNVKAGPLPLPLGLTTILDVYTKSIQPLVDRQDDEPIA